jgi:putative hydrolase of the HAD superfamily
VSEGRRPRSGALLIDYGGVLTTNIFDSFTAFCRAERLPDGFLRDLFRTDAEAQRLLAEVEEGALPLVAFEEAFAQLISRGRETIAAERLIDRLFGAVDPQPEVVEAVVALRQAGVATVLVSNSLGFAAYETLELDRLFDDVVLSGKVGLRKPDPRIYVLAAERAGVPPPECVFVDDLPHNLRPAAALGMATIRHRDPDETLALLEGLFGVPLVASRS